jgi:hypothetical protein
MVKMLVLMLDVKNLDAELRKLVEDRLRRSE